MAGSDENCLGVIRPANAQGGLRAGSGKFTAGIGHNRRALSSINRNIVEAAPYPYAVNKRGGLSEKQVIPYNNQLIPVHRPMTRKLAAQMSYHYDGYSGSKQEFIFATSDEGVEKSTQVPSAMQEASRSYDCILKSASQKNPNVSEDVPHITRCTRTMQNPSLIDSPSFSCRTPRSLSAETVEFFKQLADLIQRNKFNELKTLPPQVQLDQQTIQNYEQVLKNYLSGHLLDLAEESKYQEFNKVLTALLACRRIPPSLHQGFLSLCWELPTLASRASELHKQVTRGLLFPIARSKEKEELKSLLDKYRQVEENLVKLEQEKEQNMTKIVRLGARNEAIDADIVKLIAEAEVLQKDAAAQHYKVTNIEALGAAYEANVQDAMDNLVFMELQWRNRVAALDY